MVTRAASGVPLGSGPARPDPAMWLLPLLSLVCKVAGRVFYRLSVSGGSVPSTGPVLLVANHPNSLLDPVLVVAAAGRAVRFLAKAPLMRDPQVGWLVRGAGSIPVYRRQDNPGKVAQNLDTFRAVHAALGEGSAVGIFPEGISHSQPSISRLKTGAARIALGGAARAGGAFPIVPVGIVPERKEKFRSEMLVVVGDSIEWDDLAEAGDADREAVRELTDRIEAGLRLVTLNLEAWEDQPLVEAAEEIWSRWACADPTPAARVKRLEVTTRILRDIRHGDDAVGSELHLALGRHLKKLRRLGLRPAELSVDARISAHAGWVLRRAYLVGLLSLIPLFLTLVVFFVPYRVTDRLTRLADQEEDRVSTYKLLTGILVYAAWLLPLVVLVSVWISMLWGLLALAALPLLGLWGNVLRERWRGAWEDVDRFRRVRRVRGWLETLRAEQDDLAWRLDEVFRSHDSGALLESHGDGQGDGNTAKDHE
jgi:glycerol-3-phosphate O-acyltransferase / dihydroxyacetone phosphate acyltransferase